MGFLNLNLNKFSTVVIRLTLLLALTELNTRRSKNKRYKTKPLFDDENDFMTAITLTALLFGFHNIPKALSDGILSKSMLADWQFADRSS